MTARALRQAASGIRVNAIAPGAIRSPDNIWARDAAPAAGLSKQAGTNAVRAARHAAGHTDVVLFLCSDKARWVTGQLIVVDGGECAPSSSS